MSHFVPKKVLSGDNADIEKFVKIYEAHIATLGKSSFCALTLNDSLPVTKAIVLFRQESVRITLGFDSHAQGDFMSQRLADTFRLERIEKEPTCVFVLRFPNALP